MKPGWSATDFIKNRATALVWPIIPWTYIYIGSRVLGGGGANKPTDWSDLILFPLPPFEIFWFLWALFLIQLIAAPLRGLGPIVLLGAGVGALFITKIVPSSCAALFVPALFSLLPFMIGAARRETARQHCNLGGGFGSFRVVADASCGRHRIVPSGGNRFIIHDGPFGFCRHCDDADVGTLAGRPDPAPDRAQHYGDLSDPCHFRGNDAHGVA